MKLCEQIFQAVDCHFGVGTIRFERGGSAAIKVSPKNIYKTVGRIFLSVFHQPNFRSKTPHAFDKLRGWSRVQTKSVRNANVATRGDGFLLLLSNSLRRHPYFGNSLVPF
jgi:hypothetical protein